MQYLQHFFLAYRRPAFWLAAALLTFLVYLPGLHGPFVFDDFVNIVDNVSLHLSDLSLRSLSDAAFSLHAGLLMRPVSMLSFAFNWYLFGPSSFQYKLVNIFIHLANGILILILLKQLLASYRELHSPQIPERTLFWLGLIVGTAWMVHPLNLTAILYVVQRETSLSALFMLAGINIYAWQRRRLLAGTGSWWILFAGTAISGALAILSKESGALMPVYILVIEQFIFGFRTIRRQDRIGLATFYAVFLLIPAVLAVIWIFGLGHTGMLSYHGRDFTLGERLLTESRVIWSYILWTLLPRISSLSLYHDDIVVSQGLFHPLSTVFAIAGLIGLIVTCFLLRHKRPLAAFGIAWFFAGQLIESTVFPLQLAFEHRNYLADLGLLLLAASLIVLEMPNYRNPKLRYGFCAVIVAAFALVTLQRAWNWRNELAFAQSEAYYHPNSPYATYQIGQVYANLTLTDQPQLLPETRDVLWHSLSLPNANAIAGTTLVMVESQMGRKPTPQLLERIAEILHTSHIDSSDTTGLNSLVGCYKNQNCKLAPHELDPLFTAAFSNPHLKNQPSVAADLHVIYGNYLAGGDPPQLNAARLQMVKAAELVPTVPQYRINVVTLDLALRNPTLAEQDMKAVRLMNHFGLLDKTIDKFQENLIRLKADQQAAQSHKPKQQVHR